MTNDLDLLRDYAGQGSQAAFAELVRRHVNLVHSAALRQVRSPQLAEEVAQSVFIDLARSGDKLKPDTILTAWLYQVTRRTAIDVVRRESRRQLREQIAVEMNTMNATSADWMQIGPLLDEAMDALDDTDRSAILLRYFENKNLREVGEALGTSDDTAQKRVSRAVERLREFFSRRGVTVGAGGLVVVLSANAVQAAPAGLAVTISAAAVLAGTSVASTATATATKAIAMTALQKTLITATVAAAVGTGIYETHQASTLRTQVQTLQQQQAPLAEQVRQLQQERDDAKNQVAALQAEAGKSNSNQNRDLTELLTLRGEITRLKAQDSQKGNDPAALAAKSWVDKANQLKQLSEQMPDKKIPELQLVNDRDWLDATKNADLSTDAGVRRALSKLRSIAKQEFSKLLGDALDKYLQANNGQLPDDPSELKAYFNPPVDDAILRRYKMLRTGNISNLSPDEFVISEKAPADTDYDTHLYIAPHHKTSSWGTGLNSSGDPDPAWTNRH